jgi:hypothetical protein
VSAEVAGSGQALVNRRSTICCGGNARRCVSIRQIEWRTGTLECGIKNLTSEDGGACMSERVSERGEVVMAPTGGRGPKVDRVRGGVSLN